MRCIRVIISLVDDMSGVVIYECCIGNLKETYLEMKGLEECLSRYLNNIFSLEFSDAE